MVGSGRLHAHVLGETLRDDHLKALRTKREQSVSMATLYTNAYIPLHVYTYVHT